MTGLVLLPPLPVSLGYCYFSCVAKGMPGLVFVIPPPPPYPFGWVIATDFFYLHAGHVREPFLLELGTVHVNVWTLRSEMDARVGVVIPAIRLAGLM